MLSKILKIITNTIIGFLISVLIILNIGTLFGIKSFAVISKSMEPNIQAGSLVYVDKTYDVTDIKTGDVIAFQKGPIEVLHRVLEIKDGTILTKGDANEKDDGYISFKDYKGKLSLHIPMLGYITNFASSIYMGIIVTIVTIALIIDIVMTKRKKKDSCASY